MTKVEIRQALEAYAKQERRAYQDWTDHECLVQALTGLAILELADAVREATINQ